MKDEIKTAAQIQQLLYQKVPMLIEKLDKCSPEQCVYIVQAIKEMTTLTGFVR